MVKRSSFAKIGAIILSVVMGLGLMGIGVSYWSETLNIIGGVEMGTYGVEVTEGDCSPPISCSASGNVLTVALTDAEAGSTYECGFTVSNTGSIPVKIQSIVVVPDPPAVGVHVTTTDVVKGTQIDPGQPETGTVAVDIPTGYTEPDPLVFTVTFNVVQWNLYVE